MTSVLKLSLALGGVWLALRAILSANVAVFTRDYIVPTYLILNILLLPKTSIHIIDEVNPDFRYSKVDHVPIGIAAVASTASGISKLLTDVIEGSLKTAEATHYGKTGTLFAARLVSMARDMRIIDPVERQNLKDFVRQCFTLPMVWSNMLAGKKAALETPDLLQLIADNPHSWLGSYWRTKGGDATFRYCKEGAAKAKEVLSVEVPASLADLATGLFGSTQVNTVAASKRLKLYFEDAWQSVSHQTANAHQVAAQEMMMNIYRESSDDKRQEFGLERLHPHLIAASSARAKSQQNTGFLVSAQMVGSMLPSLQSTMLAILCVMFVVIVPMTFLPGGFQALVMWLKMILWVESWPIFYAIINCVGMMMASNRGAAYVDTGAGLSLLTQNGLADAAYDAYCYTEGFMAIIPIIAWAVISKSSSALANLSGTITRGVDGLSSKMGSEITDGNLNFDNQSFHNRSIAGYQLAQQQLGSSFSFGDKYDDGRHNITYDTQGVPIIQEAQTQLKTNVTGNDNLAASLTDTAQHALQASHNYSKMASEQLSQGINQLASYAQQYSKGSGTSEGFGRTESMGQSQDWKNTMDIAHKIAQQNNISDEKAFKTLVQGGIDSGLIGKAIGLKAGISMDGSVSAQDREIMDKSKSSGLQDQFSDSLNRAVQHSLDNKGSLTDQSQKQALESIQGSFNKAQNWQEQSQSSLQESDTFSKAASVVEGSSFASTTNWNDQVLAYAASKRGEDIVQTAHWGSKNPDAYRQYAAEFMADKQHAFISSLKSGHSMSEDQIREKFETLYEGRVQKTVGHSDVESVRNKAAQAGVGDVDRQNIEKKVSGLRTETGKAFESRDHQMGQARGKIVQDSQAQDTAYEKRKQDGVAWSTGKRVLNEAAQTGKDMGEGVKAMGGWITDQVTPDIIPSMNNSAPSDKPSFQEATPRMQEQEPATYYQTRDSRESRISSTI
ncbi:unnamed protein product [Sphagnum jensenii]|uniref:TraG N-terminal Proteobacteria domain-containing protein n=1 Tax=Sphagnum jensenii TaxID=128206 RepID=A0ABP0VJU4_9BRYO